MLALVADGPIPAGFDAVQVRTTARSLAAKRLHAVQQCWPELTAALGDSFVAHFGDYAKRRGIPRDGGPLADGWFFAQSLRERHIFPSAATAERLAVALRFVVSEHGLTPRRGLALKISWWPFVVGVHLPFLGERWLFLN